MISPTVNVDGMAVRTIDSPGGPLWSQGVYTEQSYVNQADGFIRSPGYEHIWGNQQRHYRNNLKCEYRIEVEPGTTILFVMVALSLQRATPSTTLLYSDCQNDYVQIFNGDERSRRYEMYPVSYTRLNNATYNTTHIEAQHGQMCGAATAGQLQLWSTRNVATVRFSTDRYVTSTGFLLRWTTVYPKIDYLLCGMRALVQDNGASELNPQINKRITGGRDTQQRTWMFVCQIWSSTSSSSSSGSLCGGTMVRNINGAFFMITAAHCVNPPSRPRRISCESTGGRPFLRWKRDDFEIVNVTIHPEYFGNIANLDLYSHYTPNDIAVIKLRRRSHVQVSAWDANKYACLPNHRHNLNAHDINENEFLDRAIALGWGRTGPNGTTAERLQKVVVNILSLRYCRQVFEGNPGYTAHLSNEMCVYGESGGMITNPICNGDSGGPLLTFRYDRDADIGGYFKYRWTLTGVAARSSPHCGSPVIPTMYTDVFEYRGWINEQINGGG